MLSIQCWNEKWLNYCYSIGCVFYVDLFYALKTCFVNVFIYIHSNIHAYIPTYKHTYWIVELSVFLQLWVVLSFSSPTCHTLRHIFLSIGGGQLPSMPSACFNEHPKISSSSVSWILHQNVGFTFSTSCNSLSKLPDRECNPASCLVPSEL